jgi:hypothetical protein
MWALFGAGVPAKVEMERTVALRLAHISVQLRDFFQPLVWQDVGYGAHQDRFVRVLRTYPANGGSIKHLVICACDLALHRQEPSVIPLLQHCTSLQTLSVLCLMAPEDMLRPYVEVFGRERCLVIEHQEDLCAHVSGMRSLQELDLQSACIRNASRGLFKGHPLAVNLWPCGKPKLNLAILDLPASVVSLTLKNWQLECAPLEEQHGLGQLWDLDLQTVSAHGENLSEIKRWIWARCTRLICLGFEDCSFPTELLDEETTRHIGATLECLILAPCDPCWYPLLAQFSSLVSLMISSGPLIDCSVTFPETLRHLVIAFGTRDVFPGPEFFGRLQLDHFEVRYTADQALHAQDKPQFGRLEKQHNTSLMEWQVVCEEDGIETTPARLVRELKNLTPRAVDMW